MSTVQTSQALDNNGAHKPIIADRLRPKQPQPTATAPSRQPSFNSEAKSAEWCAPAPQQAGDDALPATIHATAILPGVSNSGRPPVVAQPMGAPLPSQHFPHVMPHNAVLPVLLPLQPYIDRIAQLEAEKRVLFEQNNKLREQHTALWETNNKLREAPRDLKIERDALIEQLAQAPSKEQYGKLSLDYDRLSSEHAALLQSARTLKESYEDLSKQHYKLSTEANALDSVVGTQRAALAKAQETLKEKEAALKEREADVTTLVSHLNNIATKITEITKRPSEQKQPAKPTARPDINGAVIRAYNVLTTLKSSHQTLKKQLAALNKPAISSAPQPVMPKPGTYEVTGNSGLTLVSHSYDISVAPAAAPSAPAPVQYVPPHPVSYATQYYPAMAHPAQIGHPAPMYVDSAPLPVGVAPMGHPVPVPAATALPPSGFYTATPSGIHAVFNDITVLPNGQTTVQPRMGASNTPGTVVAVAAPQPPAIPTQYSHSTMIAQQAAAGQTNQR